MSITVTDSDAQAQIATLTERLRAMEERQAAAELLIRRIILGHLGVSVPDSPAGLRLVGSPAGPPEGR